MAVPTTTLLDRPPRVTLHMRATLYSNLLGESHIDPTDRRLITNELLRRHSQPNRRHRTCLLVGQAARCGRTPISVGYSKNGTDHSVHSPGNIVLFRTPTRPTVHNIQ
jgi:hypothetical protein